MTTIPSKRYRHQSWDDPLAALTYALVIGILFLLGVRVGAFYPAIGNGPGIQSDVNGSLEASFATDAQYWAANCSHGWTSDAACDVIAGRAQSCEISAASNYCSEYKSYLRQFLDQ